jgi:hypothetical protein
MTVRVILQQMIPTQREYVYRSAKECHALPAVSADFLCIVSIVCASHACIAYKFGPRSQSGSPILGYNYGFDNPLAISFKVTNPVVEAASGHSHELYHFMC